MINAFPSKFLIDQIPLVLESIKISKDPEIAAYFMKIIDHVLSIKAPSI